MMGEMTFNQIYGGNETTGDIGRAVPLASPGQDDLLTGTLSDFQEDAQPDLQEGHESLLSLHEYLQDNPQEDGLTGKVWVICFTFRCQHGTDLVCDSSYRPLSDVLGMCRHSSVSGTIPAYPSHQPVVPLQMILRWSSQIDV
jgi:hypothetical protein